MTNRVEAVFENGVFRPVHPVELHEGERVELAYERPSASPDPQALNEALDEIASLPLESEDRFDPRGHRQSPVSRNGRTVMSSAIRDWEYDRC